MPGFRAHYFFGDESEKAMETTPEFILNHRNVYNLGQQGPDIFFYSPQAHLFYKKNIGFVMHADRVMSFFQNLFLSREGFSNKKDLEIVDAYICGFMGHYSLDTVAHPYIHDRAEKMKYRHEFSKSFGIHVQLETDIDNHNVRHFLGCEPIEFHHYDTIKVSKYEREVVGLLLESAIALTYPENMMKKRHIKSAVSFSRTLFRWMVDKNGRKKRFVKWIDMTFFHHDFLNAIISNDDIELNPDPCNLQHREYKNPWDESMKITKDYYELMEDGKDNYLRRVALYEKMIKEYATDNPASESYYKLQNQLIEDLGDLSYDSGLPLPLVYPEDE